MSIPIFIFDLSPRVIRNAIADCYMEHRRARYLLMGSGRACVYTLPFVTLALLHFGWPRQPLCRTRERRMRPSAAVLQQGDRRSNK